MLQRTYIAVLAFCLVCATSNITRADETLVKRNGVTGATGECATLSVTGKSLVHTNQILPMGGNGHIPSDVREQAKLLFLNLEKALASGKSHATHIVKLNVYGADADAISAFRSELAKRFSSHAVPVTYVATPLATKEAKLAIDAIATTDESPVNVSRLGAASDVGARSGVAACILPAGPRVYISGQAEKGDGTLADATRQTLQSLFETLQFLKLDKSHIVQLKAFLTPMADAATVETETRKFFEGEPTPPIICVEWISSLPIEIELIASMPAEIAKDRPSVEYLAPPIRNLKPSPVYSRIAVVTHPTSIYVGGLLTGGDAKSAEQEVHDSLKTLSKLVEEAGSDLRHMVKATYFCSDDGTSNGLNKLRPQFYDPARPPTASKAIVRGIGVPGHRMTLDMIAIPK